MLPDEATQTKKSLFNEFRRQHMSLFSPYSIRETAFKNRTVMAPVVINSAGIEGSTTRTFKDFFIARARGGVAYIVLGAAFVHPDGRGFNRQLGIHSDDLMPGLTDMAQEIKEEARIGVQLSFKGIGRTPASFQHKEITAYRQAFAMAAVRARKCGFDAVELHACHEYWLNFFLSPYFNDRTDKYGGSLENRFRLLKEAVEEIRSHIAGDLLLGVRLSLTDFVDNGLCLNEAIDVGQRLAELGVDYLSASVGIGLTQFRMSPPMEIPRSTELTLSRALQQSVEIPVIGVGRLDRPAEFKEAVEGGHVSMAAAARALIADPEFVAKIEQGREEGIRPCIACNYCLTCLHQGEEVRCVVNPYVGRDLTELKPLLRSTKVVVVGGGPAGLTAAAIAAKRGARVKLFDRSAELGGTLNTAKQPPFKGVLNDLIDYLSGEVRRAGVEMVLNEEVNQETLIAEKADEIVLATGASPKTPQFSYPDDSSVVMAEEILRQRRIEAGRYMVIGGGLVGLETAEHLCHAGADVTVIEMLDELGSGLSPMRLKLILDRLIKSGVNLLTKARVISIQDRMARIELPSGVITMGPYDSVVVATGYESERALAEALGNEIPVKIIGDAREPRSIREAISEGLDCGLDIVG